MDDTDRFIRLVDPGRTSPSRGFQYLTTTPHGGLRHTAREVAFHVPWGVMDRYPRIQRLAPLSALPIWVPRPFQWIRMAIQALMYFTLQSIHYLHLRCEERVSLEEQDDKGTPSLQGDQVGDPRPKRPTDEQGMAHPSKNGNIRVRLTTMRAQAHTL